MKTAAAYPIYSFPIDDNEVRFLFQDFDGENNPMYIISPQAGLLIIIDIFCP